MSKNLTRGGLAVAVRRLVRVCPDWSRHDWMRDGSHRVATTSGYPGVPGTVEYLDYKCRLCGQHYAEISPYSFRADRNPNDQENPTT